MTPETYLSNFFVFPELKIQHVVGSLKGRLLIHADSTNTEQACYRCGLFCKSIYDHRLVRIKDAPFRDRRVILQIRKHRFWCQSCRKPFTELLAGIFKGSRVTERLRKFILWACQTYQTLSQVVRTAGCSSGTVYRSFYEQLSIQVRRHLNYSWPEKLGIDDNFFGRRKLGSREGRFDTIFVDHKKHRLYRVERTRSVQELYEILKNTPGRENVKDITQDLANGYRSLNRILFPNARITADKFHVIRLLMPALHFRRKKLAGDRRKNPIGKLLVQDFYKLKFYQRSAVMRWLQDKEELKIIHSFHQALYRLYRVRGYNKALYAYDGMLNELKKHGSIPELKTLHRTLTSWKTEILNYFHTGLTNARAEGFNNKIKLVKQMAYGYRNHENYKLRLLNACF